MNLEKFLELVFSNPENLRIEYTNINGKEVCLVNGINVLEKDTTFDDSFIKEKIANYKANLKNLNDYIFGLVIDEAEKRKFNLSEMNKGLELEHYTAEDALYADNVIKMMTELIQEVITKEIENLTCVLHQF